MRRKRIAFLLGWKGYERKSEDRKSSEVKDGKINGVHLSCRWTGMGIIGLSYENRSWAQNVPTLEIFIWGGTYSLAPL